LQHLKCCTIFVAVLLVSLISQAPIVRGQQAAHLTVEISGQSLTAGYSSNVTISVTNDYSGYIAIYDVDIFLSVPTPLAMYGTGGHWHYDSIYYGQSITFTAQIYAPPSAAGTSILGTVTATYKQLGDVSYTQEVHNISFNVAGWVSVVVYDILLTPSTTSPGGNTTVSGNILNAGNLAAYDANITIESSLLAPGEPNSIFIGEIDPNIPRPFSILVVFKQNAPYGNYTITATGVAVDYNRPRSPLTGQGTAQIQIATPQSLSSFSQRQRGPTGLVAQIIAILRSIYNVFFGASYP